MGYYSNLAIYEDCCTHDARITTPEQQLLWRLDDLRDRLDELRISGTLYGGVCNYTKSDLRYAPTGYFSTIYDVEIAIELAIEDLRNKYGIEVSKAAAVNDSFGLADNTIDQRSLLKLSIFILVANSFALRNRTRRNYPAGLVLFSIVFQKISTTIF